MRKYKRRFEDYEEIALDLRTAKQLLYQADIVFHRAAYSDAITAICKRSMILMQLYVLRIAPALFMASEQNGRREERCRTVLEYYT